MKSDNVLFIRGILLLSALFILGGCEDKSELKDRKWQLVWQGQFYTDGAPNES